MSIQTSTQKNTLASAYATAATHAMIYSTVPAGTQGTEVAGASHQALTWGAPAAGVISATAVTFSVNSGQTVAGGGVHSSVTANTGYLDGGSLTSQAFASAGTYQLTASYTQT